MSPSRQEQQTARSAVPAWRFTSRSQQVRTRVRALNLLGWGDTLWSPDLTVKRSDKMEGTMEPRRNPDALRFQEPIARWPNTLRKSQGSTECRPTFVEVHGDLSRFSRPALDP